jgi:multisubunit Na+/H+ antiporter MnhB subunit
VLLFIIGAVSVIMLIIGGIRYTISQGDQSQVTSAKNTILYAIIGLIVAILAYALVNFVVTSFVQQ